MTLTGRRAQIVVALLAASLILNFAWLGFLASRALHPNRSIVSAERLVSINPNALPPALRERFALALEPKRDQVRDAMRQVRAARQQVLAAMRADPFDQAALDTAFAELRRRLDSLSALGEVAIADGLRDAPVEARAGITPPEKPPENGR